MAKPTGAAKLELQRRVLAAFADPAQAGQPLGKRELQHLLPAHTWTEIRTALSELTAAGRVVPEGNDWRAIAGVADADAAAASGPQPSRDQTQAATAGLPVMRPDGPRVAGAIGFPWSTLAEVSIEALRWPEIPLDVQFLLGNYSVKRRLLGLDTSTTKSNHPSPADRLYGELREAREAVERFRDLLVRGRRDGGPVDAIPDFVVPSRRGNPVLMEPLRDDLVARLRRLLAPDDDRGVTDEGSHEMEVWKRGFVRPRILRDFARAEPCPDEPGRARIEFPVGDVLKLCTLAVTLKDVEEQAREMMPLVVDTATKDAKRGATDENVKDHARDWLVREWRERFPKVSRKSIARWICAMEIEAGTPHDVEERLRKAEKRRKDSQGGGRGRGRKKPASAGRARGQKKPASAGRARGQKKPASAGRRRRT